jgi:hypothetical protein
LRSGIFSSGFDQLLFDLRGFAGLCELIEHGGGGQWIGRGVPWSFDERGDKPLHEDAGQIRMSLKEIGAVATGGGNFAGIAGLIPEPRGFLRSGIVDQLPHRTGGSGVHPEHGFDGGGIFVRVGNDEEFGQLRSLVEKFDARAKGLARHQDEGLYVVWMEAGSFYGMDNSVAARASHANNIALRRAARSRTGRQFPRRLATSG